MTSSTSSTDTTRSWCRRNAVTRLRKEWGRLRATDHDAIPDTLEPPEVFRDPARSAAQHGGYVHQEE